MYYLVYNTKRVYVLLLCTDARYKQHSCYHVVCVLRTKPLFLPSSCMYILIAAIQLTPVLKHCPHYPATVELNFESLSKFSAVVSQDDWLTHQSVPVELGWRKHASDTTITIITTKHQHRQTRAMSNTWITGYHRKQRSFNCIHATDGVKNERLRRSCNSNTNIFVQKYGPGI